MKRILKILTVNCLLFGIGLMVIEFVFGGWFETNNLNRLNLLKDCVIKYDVSHLYKDPEDIIKYSRNIYGLRGTHDKPSSIDILTVGGSTTDQRYIRDGETWQDVLQDRFSRTGVKVLIANAGVDGQSTYGHIKNFKWWFPFIPDLKPKYILFYVGLNDFYIDTGYGYDQLITGEDDLTLKTKLKEQIKENSAVWHLIRTLHGAYQAMVVNKIGHSALDFSKVQWTRDSIQKDYGFMEPRLSEYANRLRVLADMTYKFGAKPIFVSQPSRKYRITMDGPLGDSAIKSYDGYEYNGVDYYHMMRRLDSVTRNIADEKDALFVDLANHAGWVDTDFYDFAHMTPQGVEKVGDLLWRSMRYIFINAEQGSALDGDSAALHPHQ